MREVAYFNDPNQDLLDPFATEFKIINNEKEGKFKALCLDFILRKSEYATMCLRELMKCSSSHKTQIDFNKYVDEIIKSSNLEKK